MVMIVLLLALVAVQRARRQAAEIGAANMPTCGGRMTRCCKAHRSAKQLEEQLRQAQKMEAIGQLTGGLAHDFNNMLAVIAGNLQLAEAPPRPGPRRCRAADRRRAWTGPERAAMLTNRMLAFARRQPLSPTPIDPNKFVAGMSDLLRRSLGEEIRLETILAGGLWRTHADAEPA